MTVSYSEWTPSSPRKRCIVERTTPVTSTRTSSRDSSMSKLSNRRSSVSSVSSRRCPPIQAQMRKMSPRASISSHLESYGRTGIRGAGTHHAKIGEIHSLKNLESPAPSIASFLLPAAPQPPSHPHANGFDVQPAASSSKRLDDDYGSDEYRWPTIAEMKENALLLEEPSYGRRRTSVTLDVERVGLQAPPWNPKENRTSTGPRYGRLQCEITRQFEAPTCTAITRTPRPDEPDPYRPRPRCAITVASERISFWNPGR